MTEWCDRRFEPEHGVELAWGEFGEGDPFVLVHGWTASAQVFDHHRGEIGRRRHGYAIDHRGHGDSSNLGEPGAYTLDRLAGDLEAWVEATVGAPSDLLGHSMGGRLAMLLALARPDLVRSLILMDTTAWRFAVDAAEHSRRLERASDEEILAAQISPPRSDELDRMTVAMSGDWMAARTSEKAKLDPVAVRALGIQIFGEGLDLGHRLGEIECPVTVIVGSLDSPYVDDAPALADGVADGRLVIIEGAWHSPQATHPHEWWAAVSSHLDLVDQR